MFVSSNRFQYFLCLSLSIWACWLWLPVFHNCKNRRQTSRTDSANNIWRHDIFQRKVFGKWCKLENNVWKNRQCLGSGMWDWEMCTLMMSCEVNWFWIPLLRFQVGWVLSLNTQTTCFIMLNPEDSSQNQFSHIEEKLWY